MQVLSFEPQDFPTFKFSTQRQDALRTWPGGCRSVIELVDRPTVVPPMLSADRSAILHRMTDLRPSSAVEWADLGAQSVLPPNWRLYQSAESRILEIVELTAILRADRFSEPEVFDRLRIVHGLVGASATDMSDPLEVLIVDYLRQHNAAYLDLGVQVLTAALDLARPWAETHAVRLIASSWPPPEMLGNQVPTGVEALASYGNGHLGRDVRRLRARAVVRDEVRMYSTAPLMWTLMMGSGGLALVRDGRSIDYIETRMN